ncbi:MAG: hypothetical protein KKE11_00015 [Gammaproteobacteria bacterium]|nr:hypothetical protein [Gammaproteobacteria bacterium]
MSKKLFFFILIMLCAHIGYASDSVILDLNAPEILEISSVYSDKQNSTDNNLLAKTVAICKEVADKDTKKAFSDFIPSKYTEDSDYKVNNSITRFWYNSFLSALAPMISQLDTMLLNNEITLKEYAQTAAGARHYARIFTRKHMLDTNGRETAQKRDLLKYGNSDGPSFNWLVERQLEKQKKAYEKKYPGQTFDNRSIEDGGNFDINTAYRSIIIKSIETNKLVNSFTKWCYYYGSEKICNYIGNTSWAKRFLEAT